MGPLVEPLCSDRKAFAALLRTKAPAPGVDAPWTHLRFVLKFQQSWEGSEKAGSSVLSEHWVKTCPKVKLVKKNRSVPSKGPVVRAPSCKNLLRAPTLQVPSTKCPACRRYRLYVTHVGSVDGDGSPRIRRDHEGPLLEAKSGPCR